MGRSPGLPLPEQAKTVEEEEEREREREQEMGCSETRGSPLRPTPKAMSCKPQTIKLSPTLQPSVLLTPSAPCIRPQAQSPNPLPATLPSP